MLIKVTEAEERTVSEGRCPKCLTGMLREGPSGGGSQNVACNNPACHAEFCYYGGRFTTEFMGSLNDTTRENRKSLYGFQPRR
jgi:hypothetical protein